MWKIRVEENIISLRFEDFWTRWFIIKRKKNLWIVVPVLNINRLCCEILEKFSNFCTRKWSK